jgi:hypothetical protein
MTGKQNGGYAILSNKRKQFLTSGKRFLSSGKEFLISGKMFPVY